MLRAQQLAHVAMEAYTAGGQGIHLPLASDHALVMIMKEMLTQVRRNLEGQPGHGALHHRSSVLVACSCGPGLPVQSCMCQARASTSYHAAPVMWV
jgi:hypothetical protein